MKKILPAALLALRVSLGSLGGAEITVSSLELASRAGMEGGDFALRSSLDADIALSGGYKYSITLGLGAEIPNLEKALSYGRLDLPYTAAAAGTPPSDAEYNALVDEVNDRYNNQAVIAIRSVKATVREVLGQPLEISFFLGRGDKLGSGDEFQERFGTVPIGTDLKGFFYYPEGLGEGIYADPLLRFDGGIHRITGTGLAFTAGFWDRVVPTLYVYHDLSFRPNPPDLGYLPGRYSADFRLLVSGETAKIEFFSGMTWVNDGDPVLRGGVLAYFGSGPLGLLLQAGIPYWEAGSGMDIDHCYFLMEPRFRSDRFGAILTLFYRPVYYLNREILDENGDRDRGRADINLKVFYGDLVRTSFEAGLESSLGLRVHDGESLNLWVSPFVSAATSGLLWDFKVRVNLLYWLEGGDAAEGFVGVRTAY